MTKAAAMADAETSEINRAFAEAQALDAPLAARLSHFSARLAIAAPRYHEHYERLIARLAAAKAGRRAPQAGPLMPDFVLPDESGRLVRLADLLAGGPLVLSFNRGHWCQYCRMELAALAGIEPEVERLGGRIAAILPETRECLATLRRDDGISFVLLRDADCGLALSLGLAMPVDEALADMLAKDGIDLATHHGGAGRLLPIPATYVIARDGRIAAAQVDPDFRARLAMEDILSALRRLQ